MPPNVGTTIAFRVGGEDAETLSSEFAPEVSAEDLTRLDRYQLALRLSVRGQTTRPFTAVALPPFGEGERVGAGNIIRRISRERYGRPRSEVEAQILRQLGMEERSSRPSPTPPSPKTAAQWTLPFIR